MNHRRRGPLALLFLNNNYHVVHHMHPKVPWYGARPVCQRAPTYLGRNEGYRYRSYAEVFGSICSAQRIRLPHPPGRPGRALASAAPHRADRSVNRTCDGAEIARFLLT